MAPKLRGEEKEEGMREKGTFRFIQENLLPPWVFHPGGWFRNYVGSQGRISQWGRSDREREGREGWNDNSQRSKSRGVKRTLEPNCEIKNYGLDLYSIKKIKFSGIRTQVWYLFLMWSKEERKKFYHEWSVMHHQHWYKSWDFNLCRVVTPS